MKPLLFLSWIILSFTAGDQTTLNTETYLGSCTHYKLKLLGKKQFIEPLERGKVKVVINRKLHRFYFYWGDKLTFMHFEYNSYFDKDLQREIFHFDSDAEAQYDPKLKLFIINTEMMFDGQVGNQYDITNCSKVR